jgi:steroid delta-isomerase-like uncharacterized protein
MSNRESLEQIARQWVSLWQAPVDWPLFDKLHADHFEDCSAAGRGSTKQAFGSGIEALVRAFPDLQTVADDVVVDESTARVAVRWTAIGTNRAAYLGVGPTHRETTITGIEIIEIVRGQVVRRWGEWDISSHLKQG